MALPNPLFRGLANRRPLSWLTRWRNLMNFQNYTRILRLISQYRNRHRRAYVNFAIADGGSEQNPQFRSSGLPVRSCAQSLMCGLQPDRFVSRCCLERARLGIYETSVCLAPCSPDCGWTRQSVRNLFFSVTEGLPGSLSSRGQIRYSPQIRQKIGIYFAFTGTKGVRRGLQSER